MRRRHGQGTGPTGMYTRRHRYRRMRETKGTGTRQQCASSPGADATSLARTPRKDAVPVERPEVMQHGAVFRCRGVGRVRQHVCRERHRRGLPEKVRRATHAPVGLAPVGAVAAARGEAVTILQHDCGAGGVRATFSHFPRSSARPYLPVNAPFLILPAQPRISLPRATSDQRADPSATHTYPDATADTREDPSGSPLTSRRP